MPTTDKNLFRSLKAGDFPGAFYVDGKAVKGLLYPRFAATQYTDLNGAVRTSQVDVEIKTNADGNPEVQTGGGTSLFDVAGWFSGAEWSEFAIPDGTEYPDNLVITAGKKKKSNRAKTVSGVHHQIEPKNPMTVDAFKGSLDTFARNAVVRSVALGHGGD